MEKISVLQSQLFSFLSYPRYSHSIRVSDLSVFLAKRYNQDILHAKIAGLLHDCAKEIKIADYENYGISLVNINDIDNIFKYAQGVLHSFAGGFLAEKKFNIKEKDILNSISNHTIGRENMSILEKIVFVADLIEPARELEGIDKIRSVVFHDIDAAFMYSLKFNLDYLTSNNQYICPQTIMAWNCMRKNVL